MSSTTSPTPTVRCVVFDIGGVLIHSPLESIRAHERSLGLPRNYINHAIHNMGHHGPYQRLERSELSIEEFLPLFTDALNHPSVRESWIARRREDAPPPIVHIDGKRLFEDMMGNPTVDTTVLTAIQRLRGHVTLAALTNNIPGLPYPKRITDLFDHFIESSRTGMRKPEPRIYRHLLDLVRLPGEACVFLDDIGANLAAAREFGIRTVIVRPGRSRDAIRELEALVGVRLIDDEGKL